MTRLSSRMAMCLCMAGITLFSLSATATPIASCNASFTFCDIPENTLLQLPFLAISGDVVLREPGTSSTVSDVFRIFNNLIDTGFGTGLGDLVFLYSSDESALPGPTTYSSNAAFIHEAAAGPTLFLGNGTTYQLETVPEPQSLGLVGLGIAALAGWVRRRSPFMGGC